MNNRDLIKDLCAASPGLQELHRHHVESCGTLMPHVFMGDVVAHVGACLAQPSERDAELEAILQALEHGMVDGDRETRNVIGISFVRDVALESFFPALRPRLGPRVSSQLR